MRFLNLTAQLSLFSLASTRLVPPYATCANETTFPLLLEATLDDLAAGLENHHFTSVDLVKAYSARILGVNSTFHAVTELNPDALSIAANADDLRKNGTILGPLHGIPILIKNNIATDDAMNNTAGSFALLGAKQGESTIAAKLRKAGAVILGKTNLSQWANFRPITVPMAGRRTVARRKVFTILNRTPVEALQDLVWRVHLDWHWGLLEPKPADRS